uniref:C3H1-type domain-containing protein n=1 Tax=Macrotermes bellicosus lispivirus 1 TaxID=3133480 RepID=A0AAT9JF42_9MONO
MAEKLVSKIEHLRQQHSELCEDFRSYRVCPRGARCQRIHPYQNANFEQTTAMLDYIIGHLHDQALKISIMQEQINNISDSLKLDQKRPLERGRARGGVERKRYSRQMRARSISSDRLSRPHTPATHVESDLPTEESQPATQTFYSRPHVPYAVGPIYNPPQPLLPGQNIRFHEPYYYPSPMVLQTSTTHHSAAHPP